MIKNSNFPLEVSAQTKILLPDFNFWEDRTHSHPAPGARGPNILKPPKTQNNKNNVIISAARISWRRRQSYHQLIFGLPSGHQVPTTANKLPSEKKKKKQRSKRLPSGYHTYNDKITPATMPLKTARADINPPKKRKTIAT